MKTLVICHDGAVLDQEELAQWLGSFSEVVGLVVMRETGKWARRRISTEIKRVGLLRFIDVLVFRLYYTSCSWRDKIVAGETLNSKNCARPIRR